MHCDGSLSRVSRDFLPLHQTSLGRPGMPIEPCNYRGSRGASRAPSPSFDRCAATPVASCDLKRARPGGGKQRTMNYHELNARPEGVMTPGNHGRKASCTGAARPLRPLAADLLLRSAETCLPFVLLDRGRPYEDRCTSGRSLTPAKAAKPAVQRGMEWQSQNGSSRASAAERTMRRCGQAGDPLRKRGFIELQTILLTTASSSARRQVSHPFRTCPAHANRREAQKMARTASRTWPARCALRNRKGRPRARPRAEPKRLSHARRARAEEVMSEILGNPRPFHADR